MLRPRRHLGLYLPTFIAWFEIQNVINLNMCHAPRVNKSRYQKGLCVRISAS